MNPGLLFLGCCFLTSLVPGTRMCLQCDSAIRHMHEDFVFSREKLTVQQQMDLKKIVDQAYVAYQDTSRELSGVIGAVIFKYNQSKHPCD